MYVREQIDALSSQASDDLSQLRHSRVREWCSMQFSVERIDEIVWRARQRLEQEWNQDGAPLGLAPGEEILDTVFQHFGLRYRKSDAAKIAAAMTADQIDREIRNLIERAFDLSRRDASTATDTT